MSVLNEEAITDTIGLLTGVFRCRRAPPPLELALGANEDKIEKLQEATKKLYNSAIVG